MFTCEELPDFRGVVEIVAEQSRFLHASDKFNIFMHFVPHGVVNACITKFTE